MVVHDHLEQIHVELVTSLSLSDSVSDSPQLTLASISIQLFIFTVIFVTIHISFFLKNTHSINQLRQSC